MHPTADDVRTLDDLHGFIHATLCAKENLLADQFKLTVLRLTRQDVLCGLQFCLRGPRSVRLAAIWAADQNTVYLYDTRGSRYAKLRLTNRVTLQQHAPVA